MKISGSDTLGRTPGQIISQNVFTLFNLLNVIIAVMLLLVHAYSNMAFLAIIILNTLIGIVQELKARKQVEKLRILNRPNATVLRNGEAVEIPADLLNVDDVTVLESGRQVCADAEILRLSHQASACAGNSSSPTSSARTKNAHSTTSASRECPSKSFPATILSPSPGRRKEPESLAGTMSLIFPKSPKKITPHSARNIPFLPGFLPVRRSFLYPL